MSKPVAGSRGPANIGLESIKTEDNYTDWMNHFDREHQWKLLPAKHLNHLGENSTQCASDRSDNCYFRSTGIAWLCWNIKTFMQVPDLAFGGSFSAFTVRWNTLPCIENKVDRLHSLCSQTILICVSHDSWDTNDSNFSIQFDWRYLLLRIFLRHCMGKGPWISPQNSNSNPYSGFNPFQNE